MTGIPNFLSHLKTYSGHPAPFTQAWIDGKPDFRVAEPPLSETHSDKAKKQKPVGKPKN